MIDFDENVLIVLLAGGRSSRMGKQNKALLSWGGTSLIGHLYHKLSGQKHDLVISANDDLETLKQYGLPLISDEDKDYQGPLAGLLAVMNWVQAQKLEVEYLAVCSCDTPFIPNDLFDRLLLEGRKGKERPQIILPQSHGCVHPLHGLWSFSLREDLQRYLLADGRRVQQFSHKFSPSIVSFEDIIAVNGQPLDPFVNINTPEDYAYYKEISC